MRSVLAVLLFCLPCFAQEPSIDLLAMPKELRKANISSRGLGCCTFRSMEYAAYWQGVAALYGLPEWMRDEGIAGGGYPAKQAEMFARCSKAKGLPTPRFIQYQGRETSIIELALKTGRLPGVTWNGNHMLSCVYLDERKAAIVDNNSPDRVQWFDRDEFVRRFNMGGGGWVVVLLDPGPPPPPKNIQGWDKRDPQQWVWWDEAGTQLGNYWKSGPWARQFRRVLPDGWSDPAPTPCCKCKDCKCSPCNCGCGEGIEGGVDRTQCCQDEEEEPAYWLGGERSTLRAIMDALNDDSATPHLTIIGTEEQRKRVKDDISSNPALSGVSLRFRVRDYEPTHWALSPGFVTSGSPTIYVQRADGAVMHRQDSYHGPEQLAAALRKVDPNYKPAVDPDKSKPDVLPSFELPEGLGKYACGGCAFLAALYLLRRKGK